LAGGAEEDDQSEEEGGGDANKRPADILLCKAQDIRTGGYGGNGAGYVALDVGIVCPQAPGHIDNSIREVLGAAEAYAREKCGKDGTEGKCRDKGIVFQPMIFESPGGVASEAEVVIKCLNKAVANNTNVPYGDVAQRFWQRISIDSQRQGHRALVRRTCRRDKVLGDELACDASGLEEPGGW